MTATKIVLFFLLVSGVGPSQFWAMHDQIFEHQSEITTESVKSKLTEFAGRIQDVDKIRFSECQKDDLSLCIVWRDINLANANKVDGTPTLFLNGRRIAGVRDVQELNSLLAEARKTVQTK